MRIIRQNNANLPAKFNDIETEIIQSNLPKDVKDYFLHDFKVNIEDGNKKGQEAVIRRFRETVESVNNGMLSTVVEHRLIVESPNKFAESIKQANNDYSKAKESGDEGKIAKAKSNLKSVYDKASNVLKGASELVSDNAVALLDSHNPSGQMKAALNLALGTLDGVTSALGGLGKFLGKSLFKKLEESKNKSNKVKSATDGDNFSKDSLEELKSLNFSIEDLDTNEDPMTDEEFEEVSKESNKQIFNDVDEITDWDSAFKYGYAKLQQVHGANYDESIAKACLEGLKNKYPNNPMVVVGALKYGGKKDKEENSRKVIDMRVQRNKNSVPGIKLWMQIYPDGSHSESYIVVDEMSESAKILDVYVSPSEPQFDNSFIVGEVIDAIDFCGVSKSRTSNARVFQRVKDAMLATGLKFDRVFYSEDEDKNDHTADFEYKGVALGVTYGVDLNTGFLYYIDVLNATSDTTFKDRPNAMLVWLPDLAKAIEIMARDKHLYNSRTQNKRQREKVDPETLQLAKDKGVVQMKPNGSWGIISIKAGEWWDANYQSEESARAALKAYHASRGRHSRGSNSLTKKFNDFTDSKPALEWLESLAPNEWGYAYLHVDGKVVGMSFGYDILSQDMDLLYVHSYGLPNRPWETYDIDEWSDRMGEMYYAINETCRKYGEKDDEFRTPNSRNSNSTKSYIIPRLIIEGKVFNNVNCEIVREGKGPWGDRELSLVIISPEFDKYAYNTLVSKYPDEDWGDLDELEGYFSLYSYSNRYEDKSVDELFENIISLIELNKLKELNLPIEILFAEPENLDKVKYNSRNSNSTPLSQSDLAAAEKYIKQINFSNFRDICKKLAKDLGEDLDLRKFTVEYDMDNFRDYIATRKDISDRLYAAIDYLISSYLRYVGHVKRNSNSRVSNLYQRIKKLADKGWKCIFDTDDGVIEFIRGGELLTIDSGNENLILSGKDIYYINKDTEKFINELKKYLI